jgi:hypothetical protein
MTLNTFNQILLEAIKLILAGIAGGLIGAWANDRLTRKREQDSSIANRLRHFRDDISEIIARLNKVADDGVPPA